MFSVTDCETLIKSQLGEGKKVRRRGDDALSPSTVITRSPSGLTTQLPKPKPNPRSNPDSNNLQNKDNILLSSIPSIDEEDNDEDNDEDEDGNKD
ncbi:hypothetical protein M0804_009118 [Polistes exclamans]|nr:hypothetical protein M0804_009118 [Polistes exclamans]